MVLEYIYNVEIDAFKTDGQYNWCLKCRDKTNAMARWQICCLGNADTLEEAFEQAYLNLKKMKHQIIVD